MESIWIVSKNIHEVLQESIEIEFQSLQNGDISPEDYMIVTEVTSSQVTAQISEFVTSKPPEEWQDSYINYMESMKKFNAYIGETKVFANLIQNENSEEEIAQTLDKINQLKSESHELAEMSHNTRP